jgi:hypothetical protein
MNHRLWLIAIFLTVSCVTESHIDDGVTPSIHQGQTQASQTPGQAEPTSLDAISTYTKSWDDYVTWNQRSEEPQYTPVQADTSLGSETSQEQAASLEGPRSSISEGLEQYEVLASVPLTDETRYEEYAPVAYEVISAGLNVRQGPSMSFPVVRQLAKGQVVEALGQEGIWVQIGADEYVSVNFLRQVEGTGTSQLTTYNN